MSFLNGCARQCVILFDNMRRDTGVTTADVIRSLVSCMLSRLFVKRSDRLVWEKKFYIAMLRHYGARKAHHETCLCSVEAFVVEHHWSPSALEVIVKFLHKHGIVTIESIAEWYRSSTVALPTLQRFLDEANDESMHLNILYDDDANAKHRAKLESFREKLAEIVASAVDGNHSADDVVTEINMNRHFADISMAEVTSQLTIAILDWCYERAACKTAKSSIMAEFRKGSTVLKPLIQHYTARHLDSCEIAALQWCRRHEPNQLVDLHGYDFWR